MTLTYRIKAAVTGGQFPSPNNGRREVFWVALACGETLEGGDLSFGATFVNTPFGYLVDPNPDDATDLQAWYGPPINYLDFLSFIGAPTPFDTEDSVRVKVMRDNEERTVLMEQVFLRDTTSGTLTFVDRPVNPGWRTDPAQDHPELGPYTGPFDPEGPTPPGFLQDFLGENVIVQIGNDPWSCEGEEEGGGGGPGPVKRERLGLRIPTIPVREFTLALVQTAGVAPVAPANDWASGGFLGLSDDGATPETQNRLGVVGTTAAATAGWALGASQSGFTGVLDQSPSLYTFVASKGVLTVRKDGVQLAAGSLPANWTMNLEWINGSFTLDNPGSGEIAEVKLWDRPAYLSELVSLEQELMTKWGIAAAGPLGSPPAIPDYSWTVKSARLFIGSSHNATGYNRELANGLKPGGELTYGSNALVRISESVGKNPETGMRTALVVIEDTTGIGGVDHFYAEVSVNGGPVRNISLQYGEFLGAYGPGKYWVGQAQKVNWLINSKTRKDWPIKVSLKRA